VNLNNRHNAAFTPTDSGPDPYVENILRDAVQNNNFRAAVWTGNNLQTVLMSIKPGEDIGLEVHPDVDQMLYILQGRAKTMMGPSKETLDFEAPVEPGYAIFVPAGTWHNIINTGRMPLKLFTVYAPPEHPAGTVHKTKADAEAAEGGTPSK
jgi:Mannose-6-phosphate isomerase